MHFISVPTCYFPTTALFIDDCQDFLLNFVLQLDEGLAYKTFTSPKKALDYLHSKRCELDLLSQRCLKEYREAQHCPLTQQIINLDIATIHAEIYNPQRFAEVSVVVVDYDMPEMDGLQFCQELNSPNIKKILLTGQADEKKAIEAFNEGLIHRYIKKSDPKAAELITKSIQELQRQYFDSMSQLIVRMISAGSPSCLSDPVFIDYFMTLCHEKNIVEYYLADSSGSFLLLDEDANVSFLVVRTAADLTYFSRMALQSGAESFIVDAIQQGEMIPCYWQEHSDSMPWSRWGNGLVRASCLQGKAPYYYTYVSGDALFEVQQNKLISYHHYLKELDAEELLQEIE